MTRLSHIPAFPDGARHKLEVAYGIGTAESFYDHAQKHPIAMRQALEIDARELRRLMRLVSEHLPQEYIAASRKPLKKRPRGALIPKG